MTRCVALPFVCGDMGNDRVILVSHVSSICGVERVIALKIGEALNYAALEIAFLSLTCDGNISALIYELATDCFIPVCGGMTQVLGHVLAHQSLRKHMGFGIDGQFVPTWHLLSECGLIGIRIEHGRVLSDLLNVARAYLSTPPFQVEWEGVVAICIGEFLVLFCDTEGKRRLWNFGSEAQHILYNLYRVARAKGLQSQACYAAIWAYNESGAIKVAYRFLPSPQEDFACGVGAMAVALAIESAKFERFSSVYQMDVFSRSQRILGTTEVTISWLGAELVAAEFSHELVRITNVGLAHLEGDHILHIEHTSY